MNTHAYMPSIYIHTHRERAEGVMPLTLCYRCVTNCRNAYTYKHTHTHTNSPTHALTTYMYQIYKRTHNTNTSTNTGITTNAYY